MLGSGAYAERHHIEPKSLGGSDAPANLITLTPEDHFFAHLLLAKIYGGGMWRAVLLMASQAPSRAGVSAAMVAKFRRHYGAAKRALAREGNNKFNPTIYDWVNLDTGETVSACLYDMHEMRGGTRPSWTSAATGDRKSYRGWTIAGRKVRIRGHKGRVFDFVNRDGRTYRGTQLEFCAMAGLAAPSASRVVRHRSVTRCGWRLAGAADRGHNAPKDGSRPGRTGRRIVLERNGELISGDRVEIARQLGTTVGSVSASVYQMRIGRIETFKGYRLAE